MPTLGMLLPVRLETHFHRHDEGGVQDQDPQNAPGGQPVLEATLQLRIRVIPDVVSLVPERVTDEATNAEARREWRTRVRGFPDQLDVVIVFQASTNAPPQSLTLHPLVDGIELPQTGSELQDALLYGRVEDEPDVTESVPPANGVPGDGPAKQWWNSYEGSVAVGLAGEVEIAHDLADAIDAIYVVGLGKLRPDAIFDGHIDREQLWHVRIGAPTNAVEGRATASTSSGQLSTPISKIDDLLVEPDTAAVEKLVVEALWPALIGDALEHVVGVDPVLAEGVGRRARRFFRPYGPYAPIRVGSVPYGFIPVSPPGATYVDEIGGAITDFASRIRTAQARIAEIGLAGKEANDAAVLLDQIAQEPVPSRFRHRRLGSLAAVPAVSQQRWDDQVNAAGIADLAQLSVKHVPQQRSRRINMPILGPQEGETIDLLKRWIDEVEHVLAGQAINDYEFVSDLPPGLLLRLLQRSLRTSNVRINGGRAEEGQAGLLAGLELLQYLTAGVDWSPLDRVARAAIDAAGRRVDPWLLGLASERWRAAGVLEEPSVGVYGWVDAPRPRHTQDIPEYLLAPSEHQALVAALARDRWQTEPNGGRWQFDLDSTVIRTATEIADEVRVGRHLSEVIGRRIEQGVGQDALDWLRTYLSRRQHYGPRRTCDGLRVLRWIRGDRASVPAPAKDVEDEVIAAAKGLDDALVAYADLLVLNGLHHVVGGRADLAKASLDAAAGLGEPPPLDVLRTPTRTHAATTTVLVGLPIVKSPGQQGALGTADPSVHAFLSVIGDANGASTWQFKVSSAQHTEMATIASLGIDGATAMTLAPDILLAALRSATGLDTAIVEEESAGLGRARRLLSRIRGTTPSVAASFPAHLADDAVVDLRARLSALATLAGSLSASLAGQTSDAGSLRARLLEFGIAGTADLEAAREMIDSRTVAAAKALADPDAGSDTLGVAIANLLGARDVPISASVDISLVQGCAPAPTSFVDDWLSTVATVRPRVAQLDVELLDPTPGADLTLAANHGQQPWTRGEVTNPLLVIAMPPAAEAATTMAAIVVDAFSESIPALTLDGSIALHVDSPGARAQQAILLATSSDPVDPELTTGVLLRAIRDARELAHARMARLSDEPRAGIVVPLTIYPGADEEEGDVPAAIVLG